MNQSDFKLVMRYVDRESEEIVQSEPQNWAILGDLTRVYREALRVDLDYEEKYYKYYKLSSEIAPETLEVKYIMYIECKNSNISTGPCNKIIQEIEGFRP